MAINEIFPNPTVKQVIFQIRFPNLFYLESKIGDLQIRVMEKFPKSSISFRRQVVFADVGSGGKLEKIPSEFEEEGGQKAWNFESDNNYQLSVSTNSLSIISQYHKTYDLGEGDKFKDIIKFVLDNFLEVTSLPNINRIGLRYIDECPIPYKDNSTFKSYYNSTFPLDRFNITDAHKMFFGTVIKKDKYYLSYIEALQKVEEEYKLILDFDAFANDIKREDYLNVTDELHSLIGEEYEKTIKEPVYKYMRKEK